jgi:hypothetical protein
MRPSTLPLAINTLLLLAAPIAAGCVPATHAAPFAATVEPTARPPSVPQPIACPFELAAGTACYTGNGALGAEYLIAVPRAWNGKLILSARGATPIAMTNPFYLGVGRRFLPEGFAAAASGFRAAEVQTAEAVADTENLREVFASAFGKPSRIYVVGASAGSSVAEKLVELPDRGYAGAYLICAIASPLKQAYLRLDTRVVYQHYCGNLPRSTEPQYDLSLGLPAGVTMTPKEVRSRVDECTGLSLSPAQRSDAQQQALANILGVLRFPENELVNHVTRGVVGNQDLVQRYLGGATPLENDKVRYEGSSDDETLNRNVLRYHADQQSAARIMAETEPTGRASVTILTQHQIHDRTVFVEHDEDFRKKFEAAGALDNLLQTYMDGSVHCDITAPEAMAELRLLIGWAETGVKPTQANVVTECERQQQLLGGVCRFNTTFQPNALATAIYPRGH